MYLEDNKEIEDMLNVTFKSTYQVKQGRKMVAKTSEWVEQIQDEASARLRAMALNWQIVNIEVVNG